MLSAILSDTVLLKSPTTTEEDRQTVEGLARHAGVDWKEWGAEMFANGNRLADADPTKIVAADFKAYDTKGVHFGIGQVEVQTLSDITEVAPPFLTALAERGRAENMDGTMLLVTDVIEGNSALLLWGLETAAEALPYERLGNEILSLPGILSRKKQLLPEILRAVEETKDEVNL